MAPYRVEVLHWDGEDVGAAHLEQALNDWAKAGWELVFIVPTRAATSVQSLMSARASADTTELAVILRRAGQRGRAAGAPR